MRKLLPAVFLTGLILTILSLPTYALPVGSDAPDFALKNLDGQTVRLSDYKGRIVLLKIGSTKCPTCMEQLDAINEIGDFLKEKDVVFLDVYLRDSKEAIEKALEDESFPMTAEALIGDLAAYKAYRVYLIPRVLLIDRDQKIIRDGSMWPVSDMKRQIEELTRQDAAAASGGEE